MSQSIAVSSKQRQEKKQGVCGGRAMIGKGCLIPHRAKEKKLTHVDCWGNLLSQIYSMNICLKSFFV